MGVQGHKINSSNNLEVVSFVCYVILSSLIVVCVFQVWAGPLSDKSVAAILLNRGTTKEKITMDFKSANITSSKAAIRDLWQHKVRKSISCQ